MQFTKVQGLGNDFVLVDASTQTIPGDLPALARAVCDRNFGVGADGLVLLWPSDIADIRMQIINSDGSEAEMCGNAIRCAGKLVYEKGLVKSKEIRVETGAGIIIPEIQVNGEGRVQAVKVNMGQPVLERKKIPMEGPPGQVIEENLKVGEHNFKVTCLSMGNPHAVIFASDVDEVPLNHWGPRIETHPVFPARANVEFVQVINESELRMRVWERGAGPTLACGTGACASAVAACLCGHVERKVFVHLAGGTLEIEWQEEDNNVYMTGPAVEVFSGDYPLQDI